MGDAAKDSSSATAQIKASVPRRVKAELAAEAVLSHRPMGELAGELIREGLAARKAKRADSPRRTGGGGVDA